MGQQQLLDAVSSLVEPETFAVLAAVVESGEIILRPIGGQWGTGIVDAVKEVAEKHPGCKMQLFERSSDWKRYFEGIVSKEQVLPYADFPPKTKRALEEIRQKVLDCRRKELGSMVNL